MRCVSPSRCLFVVLWLLAVGIVRADPQAAPDAASPAAPAAAATPAPDAPKGIFDRDSITPDLGGLRAKLADHGIAIGVLYTGEVFGNPVGGYRQGAVLDGLLTLSLDIDLEKLAGLTGFKFHALAYDPHGASGTDKNTRDIGRFSNIDAYDTFHLFELWAESSLFGNVINFRAGQLAVDAEFATTVDGVLFLNGNFGGLPSFALNVPAPVYPYASPGVRLRLNTPDGRFYFQGGIYSGNPNADRVGDPAPDFRAGTAYNDDGLRFPISGNQGFFSIYETGFLLNHGKDDKGYPGSYRIGGFFDSDSVADKHVDDQGRSLADPLSTGLPRSHDGDGGFYAVAEQIVYRQAGTGGPEDASQTASAPVGNAEDSPGGVATPGPGGRQLSFFGRLGFAPQDRNLIDFYAETGLNYRGLLPHRGRDVFGAAFTYTDISGDLRQLARDANRLDGTHDALPDYEAVLELTYQVNLAPWLQVQPDLQYIAHPGGSSRYDNALVLGVRSVVTF